ncbi:RHS repeat-associated core domain-containing protein [Edaphobacter modestus]|uniref:RHS repeat-associated core domain-containing protein n=1 Tax=Edaphobacter modestus TaxID=388466 RepID=UPI001F5F232D|nr:RHS repeat-associated core domain-containing protein [Edaphobacter modestus]
MTNSLQPDGTNLVSSYNGPTVSFTDEAGHHWDRTSDALGRLITVSDPAGASTIYTYDSLDNLKSVQQAGVSDTRIFNYDSLSHLLTAKNLETGTTCYGQWSGSNCVNGYDANGNLSMKTDARGITVNYTYDVLSRLTNKTSAGGSGIPGFNYLYGYDVVSPSIANGIGRLLYTTNSPGIPTGESEIYFYDSMGRMTSKATYLPATPRTPVTVTASYDLAGNIKSLTYPDGRRIIEDWNSKGWLNSVTYDSWNGQPIGFPYLSSASYWPDGSVQGLYYGNGTASGYHHNNRQQIDAINFVNLSNGALYSEKLYCFGLTTNPLATSFPACDALSSGNTGSVWQIKDVLNAANNQSFTYDSLDRIRTASLNGLAQQYQIDSVGNMSLMNGSNAIYHFDPATNRITDLPCAGSITPYDSAGNQLCDQDQNGAVRQFNYDADGNITQIAMLGNVLPFESYLYAADGTRIHKIGADGGYTEYVSFGGQTLAERLSDGSWRDYIFANGQRIARSDTSINPLNAQSSSTFYHNGRIGSAEVLTDGNGALLTSSQFLPFGQENSSGPSSNHYKFTGKERDTESGLDNFGARYFGSTMGRFMSPDYADMDFGPVDVPSADFENPQSLNLYSYVHNNPLTNVDPDGHDCVVQTRTSNTTEQVSVTSGNCDNVKVGDGQTKNYIAGTVDMSSIKGNGAGGIDVGYTPYSGGGGVASLNGASIPNNPGIAYGWGNNAQGYQTLGAADKAVTYATVATGVAYGAVAAGMAAPEIASAIGRSGIRFALQHGMRWEAGHSMVMATASEVKAAVGAAVAAGIASGQFQQGVIKGQTMVNGTIIAFTGFMNSSGQVIIKNVMGGFNK